MLTVVGHLCSSSTVCPSLGAMGSIYLALYECSVNICVHVSAGCYMRLQLEAAKSNCWVTICMKNVCGFIIMQKVSDTPARTNETFLEKTNLPFAVVNICSLFSCVLNHFTTVGMSIPAWESLCCPVPCNSWNKCSRKQIKSEAMWGQAKRVMKGKGESI